ncbi:gag-pol polyprotein [Tanacetum coccineum]|uniref:Gag-pol polyprotein n=1 Tax=Tanacetum coccineum TaxID=301880 RepID=A0ABQ5DQL0_9ASTR
MRILSQTKLDCKLMHNVVMGDVKPAEVTDDSKWDEMDGNAIANLHLPLADGVLSSIEEKKSAKEIWDHLARFSGCKMKKQERFANVKMSFDRYGRLLSIMTARREWFHQYKPIFGGGSVYSCNDHELKIIGIGSIMVKMHDGTLRTIRDVRHVEGLKKNLLSLGQLDDLGCKLKGEIMGEAEASVASHSPSHRVAITWHQKLGHMSEQGMKILVERKLLPGLTKVSLPSYEHCVISKQHRLKFKTSNSKSVYVLELVHSDVWQAPVLSLGGAKYFVSFIDDYSRRCWVYPIKKKSDGF